MFTDYIIEVTWFPIGFVLAISLLLVLWEGEGHLTVGMILISIVVGMASYISIGIGIFFLFFDLVEGNFDKVVVEKKEE